MVIILISNILLLYWYCDMRLCYWFKLLCTLSSRKCFVCVWANLHSHSRPILNIRFLEYIKHEKNIGIYKKLV